MIDIHCHILPEVDDGASCMEESLEMARMAVNSGVIRIAATPHFDGTADALPLLSDIRQQYQALRSALIREEIPLTLHSGAEILCLPDTLELARNRQLPTYEGTNYVLTEFYFDESFAYMDQTLTGLRSCGYRPVVAHPERYNTIQRNPGLLRRWVKIGCALQLNKGSILGNLGSRSQEAAHEILSMGLAHLIASDAHGCESRTPHMGQLHHWAQEVCEEEFARILLVENPRRIVTGNSLVGEK